MQLIEASGGEDPICMFQKDLMERQTYNFVKPTKHNGEHPSVGLETRAVMESTDFDGKSFNF